MQIIIQIIQYLHMLMEEKNSRNTSQDTWVKKKKPGFKEVCATLPLESVKNDLLHSTENIYFITFFVPDYNISLCMKGKQSKNQMGSLYYIYVHKLPYVAIFTR